MNERIGFIGAGQMARALARGFLAAGTGSRDRLIAADVDADARSQFEGETGAPTSGSNLDVVARSDVVFLAVKPQSMQAALEEIRPAVEPRHLVVSIAAGIRLGRIADVLGADRRLVRVMPNTPCLVNASAAAYSLGGTAGEQDAALVQRLLESTGIAVRVPEPLLDAVTGLSGSGPAFVYLVIEAMSDGGVRAGLPRAVATRLAAQTVLGAAKMVLESGRHPGELKDMVASPAGTTIAGLAALEAAAVRGAFIEAVSQAAERARELGG